MAATPAATAAASVTSNGAHARRRAPRAESVSAAASSLRAIAAVDHDARAGRGQAFGDRKTEARAAAGDESRLPREIE